LLVEAGPTLTHILARNYSTSFDEESIMPLIYLS